MTTHIQVDDVTPRIAYTATSGQTDFAIPFVFFDDTDLLVYVNAVLKTLTTDYTLTGALSNDDDARILTFVSGLTVGDAVVIARDIPIARTTDFPASGPLQINSLNTALDKAFAVMQQLEDSIARTLRLAASDPADNLTLPAAADRASKFLGFDADGNPMASEAVTGVAVSAFMETVLDDATAAAARTTLGVDTAIANVAAAGSLANWHSCR
jgi:hypothetical protein